MTGTVFAESSYRVVARFEPRRPPRAVVDRWRGMCRESVTPDGADHIFADGTTMLSDRYRTADLTPDVVEQLRGLLGAGAAPPGPPDLTVISDAYRATLVWAEFNQRALAGQGDRVTADTRTVRSVEVRRSVTLGQLYTAAVPWPTTSPGGLAAVINEVEGFVALPPGTLPDRRCDVVLEAGRAGAFFHELVGHPLEADVVASGTSYLSGRSGDRVAPEWLYVYDDPSGGRYGATARVDDEGTPVTRADLISAGRVAGVLSDTLTARMLGTASTGHGRRLNYRHPVLPRMHHTVAEVVGAAPVEPGPVRLIPRGLQLRRMSLRTGDFEFTVTAGLLDDGVTAPRRVGPLVLAGNAARVLAALRPGTARVASVSAKADKGCGKLGQFPLPVTFANSGLWIPSDVVEVRHEQ